MVQFRSLITEIFFCWMYCCFYFVVIVVVSVIISNVVKIGLVIAEIYLLLLLFLFCCCWWWGRNLENSSPLMSLPVIYQNRARTNCNVDTCAKTESHNVNSEYKTISVWIKVPILLRNKIGFQNRQCHIFWSDLKWS